MQFDSTKKQLGEGEGGVNVPFLKLHKYNT